MGIIVKFSPMSGGVFVEVGCNNEYSPQARCFRFDAEGNAEYAIYSDLTSSNPLPRWYGHCFKENDFDFT